MRKKSYIGKVFDNKGKTRTINAVDCNGKETEITFLCKYLGGFRDDGTRYEMDASYFLPAGDEQKPAVFNRQNFPFYVYYKYYIQFVMVIRDCGYRFDMETCGLGFDVPDPSSRNTLTIEKYDNGYVGIPSTKETNSLEDALEEFETLCKEDVSENSVLKGFCDIMVYDNKGKIIKYAEFTQKNK